MPDEFEHYHAESLVGDSLTALINTREWGVFKTEVLDKMFLSAFDLFQKADAGDSLQIIEIQQLAKAVKSIEDRTNNLIQVGRLAKEFLAKLSNEEDT